MPAPSARSPLSRRIATLVATLSVAVLVGLTAHAHGDVPSETKSCAVCAVAHDSAAPIPQQPSLAPVPALETAAAPEPIAHATQISVALPSARAPPAAKQPA